jgi:hypothetical protein
MVLLLLLLLLAVGRTAFPVLFLLVLLVLLLRTPVGLGLRLLFLAGTARLFRTTSSLTWLSISGRPTTSGFVVISLVPPSSLQSQLNIIYNRRQLLCTS